MNSGAPVSGGAGAGNRLARETSPYLRQHAANPVDWHPWGAEAFALARREDRPVFLSVGYSSCHWCHVMAHESFEDPGTAALMNGLFVCIKVDREERPEVDELYMLATRMMTGGGGWPNSVWLTPDGRPWFAGTYFPREDRPGAIGFRSLCERLGEAWRTRRTEVEAQANELTRAIRAHATGAGSKADAPAATAVGLRAAAVSELRKEFDPRAGCFGGPPLFPPHSELALLLDVAEREGDAPSLAMAEAVLDAMARGGIHDHVGGGFHRYATDGRWFLPHFEKMLSDNARLAAAYARAFALTTRDRHAHTARGVCDWLLREMTAPGGAFHTALDADSAGGEGRFYLWSHAELADTLPSADLAFVERVYGARPAGNVRDEATGRPTGLNLLHLATDLAAADGPAADRVRAALLAARERRARPGLDDKILASWNGLAIGGLATAGRLLGEPRYTEAAVRAAEFVWTHLRDDAGRLRRVHAGGVAALDGGLDDHACLADGLLDLHEATGDARWIERAAELAAALLERFRDDAGGGFFNVAHDHEELLARFKDPYDGATPSGNAVACRVLGRLHAQTESEVYRVMAEETCRAFAAAVARHPRAATTFVRAWPAGAGAASGAAQSRAGVGVVTADVRWIEPGDEGGEPVVVRLRIAPEWHIAAPPGVDVRGCRSLILEGVDFPPGHRRLGGTDAGGGEIYEGEVEFRLRFRRDGADAGDDAGPEIGITVQPCDARSCGAPVTLRVTPGRRAASG